jgi:glycosyltransferase involved in cell wall biosynthesis
MRDPGTGEQAVTLSAVITCYYEEATIDEFHERLVTALRELGVPFEIIYVNDGSTDRTFAHLESIFERMDSDLQLDPAEIGKLWTEYQKGNDVVSGCREQRADSLSRKTPSRIANLIMRRASGAQMSDFGCTFKLYNAKLIRAFEFGPHRPFNPVAVISRASSCVEVPVSHYARKVGKSGWTFTKLWSYQMEHIVRLTNRPFQYLAGLCMLFAIMVLIRLVLSHVFEFQILATVTNGFILNVLVGSTLVLLAVLAVIGEFMIRVFDATHRDPLYIVKTKRMRE